MKKIFIKAVSAFMSFVILAGSVFCVPAFASDNSKGTDIPMIYIIGSGCDIYVKDEDGTERTLFPVNLPVDSFVQVAEDNIDVFAKAVFTQEWKEFGDLVRDTISPYYHELALDENGKAPNGSTCRWTYSKENLLKEKQDGAYPTHAYEFFYDWRMDPYKIADDLHQFIEDVLEVTGEDHVAITGRCLGACIAAAYMDKYDCEYVTDLVFYASALNGATICSKLFSGDMYLDADGIDRFMSDVDISIADFSKELIQAFITVFNGIYGLDTLCWAVNNVWDNIYLDILPQILIDSFGTWPGYWSMVSDSDYIRAKENVFHNADMEKWAPFIDIIDNYHYNVMVKAPEHLKEYEKRGIVVSNITKYGYQPIPLSKPSDELSDSYCTVYEASMGATTAKMDSTLCLCGKDKDSKYISPDKQIDASTCLFPDRTWFIKNLEHKTFPAEVNPLIHEIVNAHGMTVDTDEKYPQFLVLDNWNPVPMTQENHNTTERYKRSFFESLEIVLKQVWEWIKTSVKNLFTKES